MRLLPGHGTGAARRVARGGRLPTPPGGAARAGAAALESGATTPREVVEVVYADVDESLWPAAEQSVRAQLDYLRG
jgi:hypothetical protein